MKSTTLAIGLLLLVSLCSLSGCSKASRQPRTVPVSGKVTYRGSPVAGASVALLAPGAPDFAVGTTDANGNFALTTFKPGDGAVVGTHVVTVKKLSTKPLGQTPPSSKPDGASVDAAEIDNAMRRSALQATTPQQGGSSLPAKYADRSTSDLRIDVTPPGVNNIELNLVD